MLAASLRRLPFGFYFDLCGDYTSALLGPAVLPVACAAAVAFLRKPVLRSGDDSRGA